MLRQVLRPSRGPTVEVCDLEGLKRDPLAAAEVQCGAKGRAGCTQTSLPLVFITIGLLLHTNLPFFSGAAL